MTSQYPAIHLRQEQKPLEHRSFSPAVIGELVKAGYLVSVERSSEDAEYKRIFEDSEYEAAGAKLVQKGTWPDAPAGTLILGLKEIPEEDFPLRNSHIAFAHCYKNVGYTPSSPLRRRFCGLLTERGSHCSKVAGKRH